MPLRDFENATKWYGVTTAAKEIGQLRDTIKEAIEETVNRTLEEKLGRRDGNVNEEQALAMRQLREDNVAHKKEIEDLSRAINKLTEQIRELKSVQEAANKENQPPEASPLKRKRAEMNNRIFFQSFNICNLTMVSVLSGFGGQTGCRTNNIFAQ